MSYTYKQHTWIPREIISADKMNEYETLAEYVSTLKRVAETNSYNDLDNKPQINSHELTSNLTAAQLGFATVAMTGNFVDLVGKPTKLSQFQNDRQYQTAADVATSIANSAHLKRSIVEVLPDISSADTNTIYMLKLSNGVNQNTYAEYMVVEGKWEKLGTSDVDLTQYMKTTDIEKKLAEKVPITRKINGIALNADVTIPTASPTVNGTMKLYTATGSAVDGTMTQKLITDLLNGKMSKNGNVAGGTDFNTLTASGFYIRQGDDTHGNTNAPTNGNSHYHVLVLNFSADYIRQFAYDVRSSALWTRGLVNKNWTAWERIYTTGFKPGAGDDGAVPTTRKVNGKALSSDITLTATDVGALPLTGGTLTGDVTFSGTPRAIKFSSGARNGSPIRFFKGDVNGSGIVIGDGGRTIIGAGESADALHTALGTTESNEADESMHIGSDNAVYIHSNANTVANRKTWQFNNSGHIVPPSGGQFQGSITGNAATATKLASARKINLAGDATGNVSFDGNGDVTLTAIRRGCIVGQSNNTAGSNTWYKFASCTTSALNIDVNITFFVDTAGYDNTVKKCGILSCNFRTRDAISTTKVPTLRMEWLVAGSDIDPNQFKEVVTISGSSATIECWCNCNWNWGCYHFNVLSEGLRPERKTNYWTLYNNVAAQGSATITSGTATVTSTCTAIKNTAISGNYVPTTRRINGHELSTDINLTANDVGALASGGTAVAATKATQDGNGKVIASTYVTGLTSSGTTVTVTYGNGTTKTFTTQDTNTTYPAASGTASGVMKLYGATGTATDGTITQKVITEQLNAKVPTSRTVNNKALTGNISLTASDVGALPITGGTLSGVLNVGAGVSMRTDGEGGNIDIHPPAQYGNYWEADAYNGNLRLANVTADSKTTFIYTFGTNGVFTAPGGLSGQLTSIQKLREISVASVDAVPAALMTLYNSMPDDSYAPVTINFGAVSMGILYRYSASYGVYLGSTYMARTIQHLVISAGKAGALEYLTVPNIYYGARPSAVTEGMVVLEPVG